MVQYLALLILIIGVVIPILTSFLQRRSFRINEEKLRKELLEYLDGMRSSLQIDVDQRMKQRGAEIESALGDMRKDVRRRMSFSSGGVFYLQGNYHLDRSHHLLALDDFVTAAKYWIRAKDESNLQNALKRIYKDCLPKISIEDMRKLKDIWSSFQELQEELKKRDEDGRYTNYLKGIDHALLKSESIAENANAKKAEAKKEKKPEDGESDNGEAD